jgi:hypothetical protein
MPIDFEWRSDTLGDAVIVSSLDGSDVELMSSLELECVTSGHDD